MNLFHSSKPNTVNYFSATYIQNLTQSKNKPCNLIFFKWLISPLIPDGPASNPEPTYVPLPSPTGLTPRPPIRSRFRPVDHLSQVQL